MMGIPCDGVDFSGGRGFIFSHGSLAPHPDFLVDLTLRGTELRDSLSPPHSALSPRMALVASKLETQSRNAKISAVEPDAKGFRVSSISGFKVVSYKMKIP
jgi:hypothetical protein